MPRPLPLGNGLLQSDFSAANSSTARSRSGSTSSSPAGFVLVRLTSRFLRNWTGSCFAAAANSSMKHSTAKPLKEFSTERHHALGTEVAAGLYSRRTFGIAYGISAAPPTSCSSGGAFGSQKARIEVEARV